ncbi:MAG: site-specific integrase [Tepidisphaeraceae bacterium]
MKAKRVLRYINAIFSYAIVTLGEMRYNPAVGLHVAISTRPVRHNPYLKEHELPEFLRRLTEYQGYRVTALATKFLLLTMTRTGETRLARKEEIHLDEKIWRIPAERMKMARDHWVPLSDQALEILDEALSFGGDYIFPSPIRNSRPISENTILYALYDMGYRGRLTGHGFRATASTILNEKGYHSQAIERQLAHVDRNTVRASYNHAEFLTERRQILQAWADLLDAKKNAG